MCSLHMIRCRNTLFFFILFLVNFLYSQEIINTDEIIISDSEIIIDMPVFINGKYLDDFEVKTKMLSDEFYIRKDLFFKSLSDVVLELELINLEIYNDEYISFKDLNSFDFKTEYNEETAEIHITIDYKKLKRQVLKMASYRDLSESLYLKQSSINGYFNFYPVYAIQYQETNLGDTTTYPYRLGIDSAININNFVFEAGYSYDSENSHEEPELENERFVYKIDDYLLSLSTGDTIYKTRGLQAKPDIIGLSLLKDYSLNPNIQSYSGGDAEFILENQSDVKIIINGQVKKNLNLGAGAYKINDFVFLRGVNKIQIEIRDYYGRERVINFLYPFDNSLLAKDFNDYSFAFGPSDYEKSDFMYSGYYRRGLKDFLTLGINSQGNSEDLQIGLESGLASVFGSFQGDFVFSKTPETDYSKAALFKYSYFFPNSKKRQVLSLSAKRSDENFSALGIEEASNPFVWSLTSSYSISIIKELSTTSAIFYDIGRNDNEDRFGLNFLLNYNYKRDISINLNFSPIWENNEEYDWEASIFVSLTPPSRKNTVRVSHNIKSGEVELSTQLFPEKNMNSPSFSAKVGGWGNDPEDRESLELRTSLQSYRFQLYMDESLDYSNTSLLELDNRLEFRGGTALVFTDQAFSITRPVRDSFVIIKADKSLKGQDIFINPNADNYDAKIGFFPAVIPDLSSYRVQSVFVNAPDLPLGFDLGENFYNLYPSYKSAYTITVGKGAKVYLGGYITDSEGIVKSLIAGELLSLKYTEENLVFFTDRDGYFEIQGVRPGKYELILYGYNDFKETINIQKDEAGYVDLGKIIIPGTED